MSDVFDKSKPDHNNDNNEFPIQSVIELRSLTQALLQRVTELEKAQSSYVKTIESLKKSVNALKAENVTLSSTINKLQSDFVSHATVCETARKKHQSSVRETRRSRLY